MKILFYLHRYPDFGGIEKVTDIISNYLLNKGYNISILSYTFNQKLKVYDNINHYIMPENTFKITKRNLDYISNLFSEQQFDIIIFQDSYAPIEKILFSTIDISNSRLITVEHNTPNCGYNTFWYNLFHFNLSLKKIILLPYHYWILTNNTKKRHKLLYNNSNKYILLSKRFLPILSNILNNQKLEKCVCIGNPLTIPPSKNINTTSNKKKQLLFVGRFTRQKGIPLLLKIWQHTYKQFPDWKLKLVGEGELETFIKTFIKKNKIKNIEIEGFQTNVSKYYEESKIFCMTSIFEGWGLVITEAMSKGCIPLVFDSYESVYDIIDDNINGYIIPHFNLKLYSEKLTLLMTNESLTEKISQNAIEKSNKFSIESIGKQWETLLKEIV